MPYDHKQGYYRLNIPDMETIDTHTDLINKLISYAKP